MPAPAGVWNRVLPLALPPTIQGPTPPPPIGGHHETVTSVVNGVDRTMTTHMPEKKLVTQIGFILYHELGIGKLLADTPPPVPETVQQ